MWKWNQGLYLSFFIAAVIGSLLGTLIQGLAFTRRTVASVILAGFLGVILGALVPKYAEAVVGPIPVIFQDVVVAAIFALAGERLVDFVTKKLHKRFTNGSNGSKEPPRA